MANIGFWKILRVLTTNSCNYKCVFCHNEGQEKYDGVHSTMLNAGSFKTVVASLKDSGLEEVQFSGGEPFMNPETIEMIEWLNEHTSLEIGCATNTQFLNDRIIERLATTRIRLHIQFPANNKRKFEKITRTSLFENLLNNLKKLKQHNVCFSLNYVLLTPDVSDFEEILPFLFEHKIGLKLLPFINNSTLKQNDFKKKYRSAAEFHQLPVRGSGKRLFKMVDTDS